MFWSTHSDDNAVQMSGKVESSEFMLTKATELLMHLVTITTIFRASLYEEKDCKNSTKIRECKAYEPKIHFKFRNL